MLVKTWEWNRSGGETLGQTVRGLSRVGIYVPGGTAAYPSSVLMNAIPAKVAGVGELIMVTPPTENMSNEVLAAAKIAGVDTVIAIGGTQAIAALTYGAGLSRRWTRSSARATPLLRQPRSWRSARSIST